MNFCCRCPVTSFQNWWPMVCIVILAWEFAINLTASFCTISVSITIGSVRLHGLRGRGACTTAGIYCKVIFIALATLKTGSISWHTEWVLAYAQLWKMLSLWSKGASLVAQMVKDLPAMHETQVQSLDQEGALKKGMATHSSIPAWRIPWREELGGLQSMGLQRVRQDWVTITFTFMI